jgi:hypothetical protein
VFSVGMAGSVALSAWLWRRGASVWAMVPIAGALAIGVVAGYGLIAPADNALHSHRSLAATLDRTLPPEARTVMFFHELDEGLWFYLERHELKPVPGSQPRYNEGYDLLEDFLHNRLIFDPNQRMNREKQILIDWLRSPTRGSDYVLIRTKLYDRFAPELTDLATPVLCERGLKRNDLALLRVGPSARVASGATTTDR